jgi:methyl-accepting chemotaxis protein
LPLGLQVAAGIGGLLCLVGLSVLIAVLLVLGLRNDHAQLDEHSVPYANAVAEAALTAKSIANDQRGYLISADRRFVIQLERRIPRARAAFRRAARAAGEGAQREAVLEASAGFERWIAAVRAEIEVFEAGDRRGAIESSLGPHRDLRKRYEKSLAGAQILADSAIRSGRDSVASASSRSVTILLVCLLVALVTGTGFALWVVRTILRPVYTLLTLFGDPARQPPSGR